MNFKKKILYVVLLSLAAFSIYSNSYAQYRQVTNRPQANKLHFAEVRYSFSANQKSQAFHQFMNNVETESSFSDHSEVGFVFHQNRLFNQDIHLYEHLFIMSQIGVGGEIGFDFSLHTNKVISISPRGQMRISNLSTGLREHTMLQYSIGFGLNVSFMPGRNLTLMGNYYPKYDIRYGSLEKELMTFDGTGWEYGFQLTLPRNFINPFKFLFFDLDFSRIPITFTINTVRDNFTGKKIQTRKLTISFLLN